MSEAFRLLGVLEKRIAYDKEQEAKRVIGGSGMSFVNLEQINQTVENQLKEKR